MSCLLRGEKHSILALKPASFSALDFLFSTRLCFLRKVLLSRTTLEDDRRRRRNVNQQVVYTNVRVSLHSKGIT